MNPHLRRGQDLVFVDKPAGLDSVSPHQDSQSFVDRLSIHLGQKLWTTQVLDCETTGAMVLATTPERAELLRGQFERHAIRQTYWFVTDRVSSQEQFEVRSHIEKKGSYFVSDLSASPNSHTEFKRIKRSPFFELWEAVPWSDRPHQIRLHAKAMGIPIFGDTLHGGTPAAHLCLHSLSLEVPTEETWTTPAPRFFERLGMARDSEMIQFFSALDRRQRLFQFIKEKDQCLRLIHSESPDYRLDLFGEILWCHWYHPEPPTEWDLERWETVRTNLGRKGLVIQKRQDRGADPNSQQVWTLGEVPEKWVALEGNRSAQFRSTQGGLSAGLFLDQRLNRDRVQKNSMGKNVLNLFSYTSLFSISGAKGGASSVTSVDLSKNFLEWSKQNAELNGLSTESPGACTMEWISADSLVFLRGAIKRERKWDLIICDPPSFSRTDKAVFRLKEDLEDLLRLCASCLKAKGTLLFSCNIESVPESDLFKRISNCFPHAQITRGPQDLDFEITPTETSLKSYWIQFL